jgi:hypothetical protein
MMKDSCVRSGIPVPQGCRSWLHPHKKEEPLEAALKVKQGEIRPFAEAVKLSESSRTGRPYILR